MVEARKSEANDNTGGITDGITQGRKLKYANIHTSHEKVPKHKSA